MRNNKGQFVKGNIPWSHGKKHTKEARKRMSIAIKGNIPWNKGKTGIYSEETKFKMGSGFRGTSSPMKGRKHTEEARRKMSESSKGQLS